MKKFFYQPTTPHHLLGENKKKNGIKKGLSLAGRHKRGVQEGSTFAKNSARPLTLRITSILISYPRALFAIGSIVPMWTFRRGLTANSLEVFKLHALDSSTSQSYRTERGVGLQRSLANSPTEINAQSTKRKLVVRIMRTSRCQNYRLGFQFTTSAKSALAEIG